MDNIEIQVIKQPVTIYNILDLTYNQIVKLIEDGKVNIKDDLGGNSPLFWACFTGNINIIRLLLEKGADVNIKNNTGVTPLCWCCYVYYKEAIELLLDYGAEVKYSEDGKIICDMEKVYDCGNNKADIRNFFNSYVERGGEIKPALRN